MRDVWEKFPKKKKRNETKEKEIKCDVFMTPCMFVAILFFLFIWLWLCLWLLWMWLKCCENKRREKNCGGMRWTALNVAIVGVRRCSPLKTFLFFSPDSGGHIQNLSRKTRLNGCGKCAVCFVCGVNCARMCVHLCFWSHAITPNYVHNYNCYRFSSCQKIRRRRENQIRKTVQGMKNVQSERETKHLICSSFGECVWA